MNSTDIVFVTAYKQLNRNWKVFSKASYLSHFHKLVTHIQYTLIVFVEDNLYNILQIYRY